MSTLTGSLSSITHIWNQQASMGHKWGPQAGRHSLGMGGASEQVHTIWNEVPVNGHL